MKLEVRKHLEFDPETHTYRVEGKIVPCVSEIMKVTGQSKDYSNVDVFYRDRGIAVHAAIDYHLRGILDESSLDPVCQPYFDGFKKWRTENKDTVIGTEMILYSAEMGFAGTVDLVLASGVWDYKCSKSHDRAAEIQGAAYKVLVAENLGLTLPFSVLQLPGDGTYQPFGYRSPRALWQSVMELYNWRKRR